MFQRTYSFINKDALFLESSQFQDFMVVTFCQKELYLIAAMMKRMNTKQNTPFSSYQTIENMDKDIENKNVELEIIQENNPLYIIMTLHNYTLHDLVVNKGKLRMLI